MSKNVNIETVNRTAKKGLALKLRKKQRGVTLIELAAAVVVLGAAVGAAMGGKYLLAWYNGKNEGEQIANAINCARSTWTGTTFNGVTLPTLVNNSCFPAENSVGKGTATASANNVFGAAYTVAAVQINTANDAIQLTSPTMPSGACASAIRAANAAAGTISITAGSTTTVVKASGQPINDANVATACGSADLVTMIVATTKAAS